MWTTYASWTCVPSDETFCCIANFLCTSRFTNVENVVAYRVVGLDFRVFELCGFRGDERPQLSREFHEGYRVRLRVDRESRVGSQGMAYSRFFSGDGVHSILGGDEYE